MTTKTEAARNSSIPIMFPPAHKCLHKRSHSSLYRTTNLSKALLEVVVQNVRTLGHDGQGDVVAHAKGALFARRSHVSYLRL